jgi:hypothetical protein
MLISIIACYCNLDVKKIMAKKNNNNKRKQTFSTAKTTPSLV